MLSSPVHRRTLTPPELKWLLNARAELNGRAASYTERQGKLRAQVAELEARLQASKAALASCTELIADAASGLSAMDVTIQLGFPQTDPAAAGAVKAHLRYGERGALTKFVQEHLRLVAPQGFTAAELKGLVIQRFGLVLLTRMERDRLKSSLSTTLRQIRDRYGTVEAVSTGVRSQTRWYWKQPTTLDDLRRMVERSSMSEEEPPDERAPHPNKI